MADPFIIHAKNTVLSPNPSIILHSADLEGCRVQVVHGEYLLLGDYIVNMHMQAIGQRQHA